MNVDLAASLRTSFWVRWLLPKRLRQSDQKKSSLIECRLVGQNRSKAPCHGIDTHDASACRFLIEGGDDLGLEPPPGADSYLFSGAPVERRSWRAEGQRPFARVPTVVGAWAVSSA